MHLPLFILLRIHLCIQFLLKTSACQGFFRLLRQYSYFTVVGITWVSTATQTIAGFLFFYLLSSFFVLFESFCNLTMSFTHLTASEM